MIDDLQDWLGFGEQLSAGDEGSWMINRQTSRTQDQVSRLT